MFTVKSFVFNLRANINVIVIMCRYDSTICYNEYRFEQRNPYYVCRFVRLIFKHRSQRFVYHTNVGTFRIPLHICCDH